MTPTPPAPKNKNRKPGLTAKGDQRQYVQHSYTDRSSDAFQNLTTSDENTLRLYREDSVGGPFPIKLHIVLKVTEKLGQQHIISWLPHGRSFMIHRPREFEEEIMGKFFKQTKLTSFRRQLNLYDFQRITHGRDAGSYYHELFLRGRPLLAKRMIRRKVKGTKIRASSSPDDEPNFYTMPFMGPMSNYPTSCQTMSPAIENHHDQMLGAAAGGNLPSSLSRLQSQNSDVTEGTSNGNGSRQFADSLPNHNAGLRSLQNPLHQNALSFDLMRQQALNRMQYPGYGGAPQMDNLDYLTLSALHRNRLASAYPSYLHQDAALLDSMARLQASGMDPALSRYNESLLRASQLNAMGGSMGLGGFQNAHAGNLSSMLMNQRSLGGGTQPSSPAARLLLEQMNLQQQASPMRQSTSQSLDEKQNAIEQLLLLQKDRSATTPIMPTKELDGAVQHATHEEIKEEVKIATVANEEKTASTVLAL